MTAPAETWPCRFCREFARGVVGNVCGCGTVRGATLPTEPALPALANPFPCASRAHSSANPTVVQSGDTDYIVRLTED